jgi:succinyl-CoA synthetase alpha subunit
MSILLDETTRILIQGATGRQARSHVRYMQEYGTKVVAGVSPGHGGEEVNGFPVYDSVADALAEHEIDITVLFIPGIAVKGAALEAIEAGIPHVHILAEGVPHHDASIIIETAARKGIRVVGPNSQGIISVDKAKIGGTGGPKPSRIYSRGPVGIIARSGGMGGEIANILTLNGIGQSTFVPIGGDFLVGTSFTPLLELFERDPDTEAVAIFGEAGTGQEEAVARMIAEKRFTKPLVALIIGDSVERLPKGLSFGHTGSIIERGVGSPAAKREKLREAGAKVADKLADMPGLVRAALK